MDISEMNSPAMPAQELCWQFGAPTPVYYPGLTKLEELTARCYASRIQSISGQYAIDREAMIAMAIEDAVAIMKGLAAYTQRIYDVTKS